MLPGGPLAKKQLTKLKIYNGENHPHDVQKPKIINFENYIKVILSDNGTNSQSSLKSKKIKLDFKDSKYATGRRKKSIAKVWVKKFWKYSCQWVENE